MQANSLSTLIGSNKSFAQDVIDNFLRTYTGVASFIKWSEKYAEQNGFVKTPLGRKRHLPEARLKGATPREWALKNGAFRKAVNSQIQGFASDIIAVAMRNIRREFKARGWWMVRAMLTLQVHDESLSWLNSANCWNALKHRRHSVTGNGKRDAWKITVDSVMYKVYDWNR